MITDFCKAAANKLGKTPEELGEPEYYCHLEYVGKTAKGNKSDKYWQVGVFAVDSKLRRRFVAIRRWGKYGTNGQCKAEGATSRWSAMNFAEDNEQKKRAKGYSLEIDIITRLSHVVDADD